MEEEGRVRVRDEGKQREKGGRGGGRTWKGAVKRRYGCGQS